MLTVPQGISCIQPASQPRVNQLGIENILEKVQTFPKSKTWICPAGNSVHSIYVACTAIYEALTLH